MGTRNLTIVISGGKPVIAQYGQWDGYLSGAGVQVAEFVDNAENIAALRANAGKCRFGSAAELDKIIDKYSNDGWMDTKQAARFKASKHAYLSRDTGCDILGIVARFTDKELLLRDDYSFAGDSLFCEYCYVVDLDKNKLEIYTGFNKRKLGASQRFAALEPREGYFPVRCRAKFKFGAAAAGVAALIAKGV